MLPPPSNEKRVSCMNSIHVLFLDHEKGKVRFFSLFFPLSCYTLFRSSSLWHLLLSFPSERVEHSAEGTRCARSQDLLLKKYKQGGRESTLIPGPTCSSLCLFFSCVCLSISERDRSTFLVGFCPGIERARMDIVGNIVMFDK